MLGQSSLEKLIELKAISHRISELRTSEPDGLYRVDPCALRTGIITCLDTPYTLQDHVIVVSISNVRNGHCIDFFFQFKQLK